MYTKYEETSHLYHLARNGGFTFDVRNHSTPKSGFAVSTSKQSEEVYNVKQFTPMDIVNYVVKYHNQLSVPSAHLGAWRDGEKIYLDVALVVDSEDDAERLARENDQLAYYDVGRGETVYVTTQFAEAA